MKVAVVQMNVKILERQRNLEKILAGLESAACAGAGIVVFPECALTGYCFAGREEADPVAEPVPGPSSEKLWEAAKCLIAPQWLACSSAMATGFSMLLWW